MTSPNFDDRHLNFKPPGAGCCGVYFATALANWAINYRTARRPPDCWYLVRVKTKPWEAGTQLQSTRMEFKSTDPEILARFRHPTGRLYYKSELYPVCNRLNRDDLVILAVSLKAGGLTKWVHDVATKALEDFKPLY